jgi:hypothetical protein
MTRTQTAIASFAILLASGAALAQIQPREPIPTQERIPPGGRPLEPKVKVTGPCRVDPRVGAITLAKVSAKSTSVQITFEVINGGPSAWSSGANQQSVTITARNNNSGAVYRDSKPLSASAASGARMLYHTTPTINDAFDNFEFGGTVDVSISYDPDIYTDGNNCNDDTNPANNRRTIDYRAILAFMNGSRLSQTF